MVAVGVRRDFFLTAIIAFKVFHASGVFILFRSIRLFFHRMSKKGSQFENKNKTKQEPVPP